MVLSESSASGFIRNASGFIRQLFCIKKERKKEVKLIK